MICAYDELYLPLAQRMLGDMYDYAVRTMKVTLGEFQKMFLHSGISRQIANGNPHYIAGKNGCEVAREVLEECTGEIIDTEDRMYLEKSPEYWVGWSLAFCQWKTGREFRELEQALPVEEMRGMYLTYHEADITLFAELMDERLENRRSEMRLKRLRAYAGLSQSELAGKAGVPLRQIQLFEQGQRDIRKTQGQTLEQLAKALNCPISALLKDH